MAKVNLAIPSCKPGGLEAQIAGHFGHCDVFTIVEIEDNFVKGVSTLANLPHEEGGCMAPVRMLAENGVNKMLAGGMGMRPLAGFNQAGIHVYHTGGFNTVGEGVSAYMAGNLSEFSSDHTCKGH